MDIREEQISEIARSGSRILEEELLTGVEGQGGSCASILASGNDVSDMDWHTKFHETVSRKALIS